jgi:hypothetical protein
MDDHDWQEQSALIGMAAEILSVYVRAPVQSIEFLDLEQVDWPGPELGCPGPGDGNSPLITPGFRLRFLYSGETYEVHADQDGRVRICHREIDELSNPRIIEGTIRDGHPNQPVEGGFVVPKPAK